MPNYNPIADGGYISEHKQVLKDLKIWRKMTVEEKHFFNECSKCDKYRQYADNAETALCPCLTCRFRKTEIQVDNKMITLRKKYM